MPHSRSPQIHKFLAYSIPLLLLACSLFSNLAGEQPPTPPASLSLEAEIPTQAPASTSLAGAELESTRVNSVKIVSVSANSHRNLAIDAQAGFGNWEPTKQGRPQ